METLKIGELAVRASCPVETIRYYEREALLPAPVRSNGNYRLYGKAHVERLSFIRHCRSLDMTLEEIRTLLRFRDSPQENCDGANQLLDQHIGHVAARIADLTCWHGSSSLFAGNAERQKRRGIAAYWNVNFGRIKDGATASTERNRGRRAWSHLRWLP